MFKKHTFLTLLTLAGAFVSLSAQQVAETTIRVMPDPNASSVTAPRDSNGLIPAVRENSPTRTVEQVEEVIETRVTIVEDPNMVSAELRETMKRVDELVLREAKLKAELDHINNLREAALGDTVKLEETVKEHEARRKEVNQKREELDAVVAQRTQTLLKEREIRIAQLETVLMENTRLRELVETQNVAIKRFQDLNAEYSAIQKQLSDLVKQMPDRSPQRIQTPVEAIASSSEAQLNQAASL